MGKIYYLFGKSATGKDSIYRKLCEDRDLDLFPVVLYTTRPKRSGENEGETYHFISEEKLNEFVREGKVIEMRTYHTVYGPWSYATIDDGTWNLEARSYLATGVLESFCSMRAYFGREKVIPLYIEVEDGERLARALHRERQQLSPHYEEMCRRFLADQKDFASDKLQAAEVKPIFYNDDLERCTAEIKRWIAKIEKTDR